MSVLDSLIRVQRFRLEALEQQRSVLLQRMARLHQSRQQTQENLRQLQAQYAASTAVASTIAAPQLLALRQIWIDVQERQHLCTTLDQQIAEHQQRKTALDQCIGRLFARLKAVEGARDQREIAAREQQQRESYAAADERWTLQQHSPSTWSTRL